MQQTSLPNPTSTEPPGGKEGSTTETSETTAKAPDPRILALENLLQSPQFKASERNRRFLRFVVEETIAGRAGRIKAFTIAVDVFGRGADFDGAVDPIVRIAAGQLRKSLRDYYTGAGRHDPVEIGLPLGAYVPSFEARSVAGQRLRQITRFLPSAGWLSAAAVIVSCAGLASLLVYNSYPGWRAAGAPPRAVVVLDAPRTSSSDPGVQVFAQILTQALWVKMGQHDSVRLVGVRPEDDLHAVSRQARELVGEEARLFQLLTTVQADGETMRIYWHLVDADTREAYYSSLYNEDIVAATRTDIADNVAADMAASLFSRNGVLAPTGVDGRILAKDLSE